MEVSDIIRQHQDLLLPYTERYLRGRVLDVGCGSGLAAHEIALRTGARVQLCDVVDIRNSGVLSYPFQLCSADRLSYRNNSFDTVYLQYVLHHLSPEVRLEKVLSEAQRVSSKHVVIVEETISAATNMCRAREFDEQVNGLLHSDAPMRVQHYYTHDELRFALRRVHLDHLVSAGNEENGRLETRVYVLAK